MNISDDSARDRMIYELGNMFTARLGLEELIPLVISKCREVLDADGVSVLLLDEERDELYFPYVSEDDPEVARRLSGLRIPADSGLAGAALRSGQSRKGRRSAVRPPLLLRRGSKNGSYHKVAARRSAANWRCAPGRYRGGQPAWRGVFHRR